MPPTRLGNIFDLAAIVGDDNGLIPPKVEHLLTFEARLANRLRVNAFILEALRP